MFSKKSRIATKIQTKTAYRRIILFSAGAMFLIITVLTITLNIKSQKAYGASSGDYQSITSGNWNNPSTWQTFNGSSWVVAVSTPSDADATINIQSGHTVFVTANVTVDQLVVDAGGTLEIESGKTLTIKDGNGTNFTANGPFTITGSMDQFENMKIK